MKIDRDKFKGPAGGTVIKIPIILSSTLTAILSLSGCSDTRKDPCRLLTAEEVSTLDDTADYSLWAGRGGEEKDDEVCVFYTTDGDPRVMLFVWYDKEKSPRNLISQGEIDKGSTIVDLPGIGSEAAAVFTNDELKLLAVKSSQGVVGLRVRIKVKRDSLEFLDVTHLAETALSRI